MARKEFPQKVRAAAFKRCGGPDKSLCEGCGLPIKRGGFHYDHAKADTLGGEPTLENCVVLCTPCHKAKTKEQDMPVILKSNAQRKAHTGTGRVKVRIPTKPKVEKIGKPRLPPRNLYEEIKP
jgi:5-methylcytosine-specific restriction protein A